MVVNIAYKLSQGGMHRRSMDLGIRVPPEQFGRTVEKNQEYWLSGTDEDALKNNMRIRVVIQELEKVYFALKEKLGAEPRADTIVDTYRESKTRAARPRAKLMAFLDTMVEDNNMEGATARLYVGNMKGVLANFLRSKYNAEDFFVDEIDTVFLYRFELFMKHAASRRGKPFKEGTQVAYIGKMISIVNYAKKVGEITKDIMIGYDPYSTINNKVKPANIVTTLKETVFWKIAPADLHKIETIQPQGHAVRGETATNTGNQYNYDLVRIRHIFLLQTWVGFSFADLVAIRDVRHLITNDLLGRKSIVYYRAKTGELAIVPVFEQTERLLEALDYNPSPLSSYDTASRKIKALLRYYNIAIPEETVTHLGRHLFGSRMLTMGFSMESISRMMGHTSIKMTESVYAKIDLTKIQADYSRIQSREKEIGTRIAI